MSDESSAWPSLPLQGWQDSYATLHMWSHIVGKTRLALAPPENHWWHSTLYVTARGLTTSPMPWGAGTLAVDFDFIDHTLTAQRSDGAVGGFALGPRSVAEFYREYTELLADLGGSVPMLARPVEVEVAVPFARDEEHASYDADAVHRWWRALVQADRVLKAFRGRFLGKSSPVHFFWGAFDLAATRFSGRTAPRHGGGVPNCADWVMEEAYSHECASAGFWPGGGLLQEAAFYAYAYPEPAGYAQAAVGPRGAYYHPELREYILPWEVARTAERPAEAVLEFLQSTYAAAADLGGWDRAALERDPAAWRE